MNDKKLESKLNRKIDKLELLIDEIAPTPLRHTMSRQIVKLRMSLKYYGDDEAKSDEI